MKCDELPRGAGLPELFRRMEYAEGVTWELITPEEFFDCCAFEKLKHFRSVINSKLSRRTLDIDGQRN